MANSSFNIDTYNRYFTEEGHKGWWSEKDKKTILNLIDEDGLKAYGDINTNVLGLAFGNFAFAVHGPAEQIIPVLKNKNCPTDIPGIIYTDKNKKIIYNSPKKWDEKFLGEINWNNI